MQKLITDKNAFTMSYDEIMRLKTGSGITQLMKLIYCRVLRFTENGQECFMSNTALADEFGTTARSITDATNALVGLSAMNKIHRFNDSNIYIPLLWNADNKFSEEYLAEIERKKKAKKGKKSGDEETSRGVVTSEDEENNLPHEETSSLEVKELLGGIEETSRLGVKKLPSNIQINKQVNIQRNKQIKEADEIEVIITETPHKQEVEKESSNLYSLPSTDSFNPSPSIVAPSLADLSDYKISNLTKAQLDKFFSWDARIGKDLYPGILNKRIYHFLHEVF